MINIGLIGYSNIAKNKIIPTLLRNRKFKIYAIASNSKTINDRKLKNIFHNSYEEVIQNNNIDLVYISLPNSLHYKYTKQSLLNSKNVIIEKPICLNLKNAKELVNIAKKRKLFLIESFQFLHHSQLKYIKNYIRDNKLGKVSYMTSTFTIPHFKNKDNIRYKKRLAGGSLYDLGVYPIRVSTYFLGILNCLYSNLCISKKYNIDTSGHALLFNKTNKNFSQINFGFGINYQCSINISFENCRIYVPRIFTCPKEIRPEISFYFNNKKKLIKLGKSDHFKNLFDYIANSINNKTNFNIEYQNSILQTKLLEDVKLKSKKTYVE